MKQRKFESEMRMQTLMLRIDVYDAIASLAEKTGKSKGMLIEEIIEKYLARLSPEKKGE